MKRAWMLSLALLALWGCPTREFYRESPEVSWEARHITRVAVPTFDAEPNAWMVGEDARKRLIEALQRGTVEVADDEPQATVKGVVGSYTELATPSSPHRVEHDNAYGVSYTWEMDVTNTVDLRLMLRVLDDRGTVLWTKEGDGTGTQTTSEVLNWPGADTNPPPAVLPRPTDPAVFAQLREGALDQALPPLIDALTVHYGYRNL